MELRLINFKCYDDATFTINPGITRIHGRSGSGKSTIFDAIKFAFTGKGKKLPKLGQSGKTIVILKYNGTTITRTKNPCSVMCDNGTKLQHNDAQAAIDALDFMPQYAMFRVHDTFLRGSLSHRKSILDYLCFSMFDVVGFKKQLRDKIKSNESDAQKLITIRDSQQRVIDTTREKPTLSMKELDDQLEKLDMEK